MIKKLTSLSDRAAKRKSSILSFKARANQKRSFADKLADLLTVSFGTVTFLLINAVFFLVWIVWNMGAVPNLPPIDPFPFGLLTMVVSLEAIFLAIIVLISQNREARVAELREEVELYINTYAESEVTKLIHLVTLLLEKQNIDVTKDPELQEMLEEVDSEFVERELQKQLEKF